MRRSETFFEHEFLEYAWSDRTVAALARVNRAYGAEILRPTIHQGKRKLQAAEYVGVARLGAETFQILPKMFRSANREIAAQEAARNLLHMLAYANELQIREHALAPLLTQDADWFEILTRLFATHLQAEWQRGAQRNYQRVEDELPLLKGKWRIGEQLRHPLQQHRFFVAYDEFTSDNALNRVFRFVVERLWHLTRDAQNRQRLGELRQWLDEVTLVSTLTVDDAPPTLITRLNERFAPLLNLARLFLAQRSLQLAARDVETFAFVLDMNALFEGFLVNFIRRHRDEILPQFPNADLLAQTRGATRHLAEHETRGKVFHLKPDLAVCAENSFPLLVDTKYKTLDLNKNNFGVSQSDFYQMYAYSQQYECPHIVLLYPQTAGMENALNEKFQVARPLRFSETSKVSALQTAATIRVATVDVRGDLGRREERGKLIAELKTIFGEDTNG
jgi:5-methylcytosine-specific restriction enzyme subunit McrC